MRVFGLTGGIASGKSTVARCFRDEGFPIVDADVLARQAVAPGSRGLAEIVETFGPDVLDVAGNLDRKRLGSRVFADKDALGRLNAIVHPRVAELAMAAFEEQRREGAAWVGYEVPLLVENGLHRMFKPVVVVATDEVTQLRRLIERDGLSEADAKNRIASQLPLEQKLSVADFVIENAGSIDELRAQVARVASALRELEH